MRLSAFSGLSVVLLGIGLALAQPADGLRMLSEARPEVRWDAATVLRADFDCDGQPDQAFLGRGGGRVYVAVVRPGKPKPEILDFDVSSIVQQAICGEPAVLRIESLDYDPAEAVGKIEGFRRSKRCKGLRLEGGGCDSVHIFKFSQGLIPRTRYARARADER
jgi:hypothetical protein